MPPSIVVADIYTMARKVTLIDLQTGECVWVEHPTLTNQLDAFDQANANLFGAQVILNPKPSGEYMEYIVVKNGTSKRFTIAVTSINEGSDTTSSRYCSGKCMPYSKACAAGKTPGCDNANVLQCYPLALATKTKKQKAGR